MTPLLDFAERAFSKCVETNEGERDPAHMHWKRVHADSGILKVEFNYEFLEDFQDEQSPDKQSSDEEGAANIDARYYQAQFFLSSLAYIGILILYPHNSAKSWQPKKFTKHSHPFFLIVRSPGPVFLVFAVSLSLMILTFQTKHGCSNLMKHPLVIRLPRLLDYKWKKFGNLFIYLIFLVFLTAFGLKCGPQSCGKTM